MANTVSKIISDRVLSTIIQIESGGRVRAKAPTSSASGLGQFINATWMATVRRHRPEWLDGKTTQQVLDMRFEPRKMIEMLARFEEDNARGLPRGWSDGDLYLAHFSGLGTAKRLIAADPSAPASTVFTPAAIRANRSILEGKTCGEVRAWANRKMKNSYRTDYVKKYWGDDEPKQEEVEIAPPVSRAVEEEIELNKTDQVDPRPVNPEPTKTGISAGAKTTTGLGVFGIIALVWEQIQQAPPELLTVIVALAAKPSFWFVIAVFAVGMFIWIRRNQTKETQLG